MRHFYPRPPRGGRPAGIEMGAFIHNISIHALREEGDMPVTTSCWKRAYFYPRPPRGGRLSAKICDFAILQYFYPRPPRGGRQGSNTVTINVTAISIHALREEGDSSGSSGPTSSSDFYPRPPRGGRLFRRTAMRSIWLFLSTPSARRATSTTSTVCETRIFLSTPSARRATGRQWSWCRSRPYFYPRPPRGGRRDSRTHCEEQ